jgi:WD40 repeat protein
MADNMVTFLYDANQFAVAFREVIESSVAHIYLSVLPSVQKTSKIAEVFMPKFASLAKIIAEGIQVQQRLLLELRGHTDCIRSVGFSPDGTHIVSGSDDKTIRVWNAKTGEEVMKPLEGHTHYVTSVGFSPDGTHIVSGSHDKTIRIWDVRTGEEVMKPLNGHTYCVRSVGFSPDGTHIVSGSDNKTMRVWDVRTGEEVMKPLEGDISSVIADIGLNPSSHNSVLPNFQSSLQSDLHSGSLSHGDGWVRGFSSAALFLGNS